MASQKSRTNGGASSVTTSTHQTKPDVYSYMDYRTFLADFYSYKQATDRIGRRRYNYTAFAAAADIKSPNYLKLVIEGKRNLSLEMASKFAKAIPLDKYEEADFVSLVDYNQEADPLERSRKLQTVAQMRLEQKCRSGEIKREALEFMPSWVTWVVHQMADQEGVNLSDKLEMAKLIRGNLKAVEIESAYDSLLKAGVFRQCDETGEISKVKDNLESPETVPFDVVRKLQAELIYLGLESLFKDASSDREFGAITMSLTKTEFEQLRFDLRKIRKAYARDFSAKRKETPGERVYQLNIQLFPLTDESQEPFQEKKMGPLLAPKERGERGEKKLPNSTELPESAPEMQI